jgi:hypothetical protein
MYIAFFIGANCMWHSSSATFFLHYCKWLLASATFIIPSMYIVFFIDANCKGLVANA